MGSAGIRGLSIAVTLGLVTSTAALAAREPTLSDIARCNEQAALRTGAGALPRTPEPHAGAGRPDAPGPADRAAGAVPRPGAEPPLATRPGPAEKTDPSGSVIAETPDPLVKGMDASKADDPPYRAAYRECMRASTTGR